MKINENDSIMDDFAYQHLPGGPMRETSAKFHALALDLDEQLRGGRNKVKALDMLLLAKDAAVRQVRADLDAANDAARGLS